MIHGLSLGAGGLAWLGGLVWMGGSALFAAPAGEGVAPLLPVTPGHHAASVPSHTGPLPAAASRIRPPGLALADTLGPPLADTLGPVLAGRIRAPGYREDGLLPGALVELRQGGRSWTAVADASGGYRLQGPRPGRARLSIFHVAVHSLEMELLLPERGQVMLDLELEFRAIPLAGVEVGRRLELAEAALRRPSFSSVETRLHNLALRSLEASPGMVESGLGRAVPRPPPGEEHREPDRILFTRGSTVDSRQFLLDGAPILTPFHLAGMVPAFDARVLEEARMYVGGAPARYEGGLSHMLDVHTREPRRDRIRMEGALDPVAVRAGLEAPLPGGGGILAAGRLLHGAGGGLQPGGGHPYGFGDLVARAGIPTGETGRLRMTGFLNRESVDLEVPDPVSWGNRALSVGWSGRIGDALVSTEGALTRYEATLPVLWPEMVLARSRAEQGRTALLVQVPWEEGELQVGASADRLSLGYQLGRGTGVRLEELPPGTEPTQLQTTPEALSGDRVGFFLEADRRLGERWRLRGGGRVDRFSLERGLRIAPRASLELLLTEEAILTLSGGRYHQQIPVPRLMARTGGSAPPALSWDPELAVASASHLVLSLDQELSPELTLGVSGFVKNFDGTGRAGGAPVNSSGTDLRVGWESERAQAWAGYAISWFWEPGSGGRSTSFSGRHLLTTGTRIEPVPGVELGLSLGYGAGLPLTAVAVSAPEDFLTPGIGVKRLDAQSGLEVTAAGASGAPLSLASEDEFIRLDLDLTWVTHPRIGGRRTELRPYLRILNALDQRDALFHYFDRWMGEEMRPVAERPFLPLIGVEWRF